MNPLPEAWFKQVAAESSAHPLVLVDTAMQQEVGRALIKQSGEAVSILGVADDNARALGLWLMGAAQARAHGIDGSARGVNWLLSTLPLDPTAQFLQQWAVGPLPDGTERGYLRLGDGRTLCALMDVWTREQRAQFCSRFYAWCYSDRDGHAQLLQLTGTAASGSDDPSSITALDSSQYEELLRQSVPDQLMHELKGYVRPHASLSGREDRHRMTRAAIAYASSIGYTDVEDQMTLIAWALRAGIHDCQFLAQQPPIQKRLKGAALWEELIDTDIRKEDVT